MSFVFTSSITRSLQSGEQLPPPGACLAISEISSCTYSYVSPTLTSSNAYTAVDLSYVAKTSHTTSALSFTTLSLCLVLHPGSRFRVVGEQFLASIKRPVSFSPVSYSPDSFSPASLPPATFIHSLPAPPRTYKQKGLRCHRASDHGEETIEKQRKRTPNSSLKVRP